MNNINLKNSLLNTLTKYYENLLNTDIDFNITIKEINDVLFDKASEGKDQIILVFNFDVFPRDGSTLVFYTGKYDITLPYINDLKSFNKVKSYYSKIENFNVRVTEKTHNNFKTLIELTLEW